MHAPIARTGNHAFIPVTKKRITSVQLAKLAGVSHATVSRAFNAQDKVREATRDKILRLARKHGYSPNAIAASLNRSRTQLVAIVVNAIGNLCESEQLDLLLEELQRIGLMPLLLSCDRHEDIGTLMRLASSYRVDYAVVFSDLLSAEDADNIFGPAKTILVTAMPEPVTNMPTVLIDAEAATLEAVEHLVESGRRSFCYLSGRRSSCIDRLRFQTFARALARHDLRFIVQGQGNFDYDSGFKEASMLLSQNPTLDAVIAANDAMAIGIRDAAVTLHHRNVPEDLAVIGHDGVRAAFWACNNLSTIALDHREYAHAIINKIQQIESNDPSANKATVLPCRFRRGGTS